MGWLLEILIANLAIGLMEDVDEVAEKWLIIVFRLAPWGGWLKKKKESSIRNEKQLGPGSKMITLMVKKK